MTSVDLRLTRPAGLPPLPVPRVADLPLRGRVAPVATRVYWPVPCSEARHAVDRRTALVVLVAGRDDPARVDALAAGLCAYAGVVVLSLRPPADPSDVSDLSDSSAIALRDATTALDWAADHAAELGADPQRLVVAGWASGAGPATVMACRAAEQGWPAIARQILLCPDPTTLPPDLAVGAAPPSTVVTIGRDGEVPSCGVSLRRAGVRVDELRYEGLPDGEPCWAPWTATADLVMADLARSLQHRLGLPPTVATRLAVADDEADGGTDAAAAAAEIRSTGGGFV